MEMTGVVLFAMIPAMAITMLNLGIGPFGHPSLIRHHQKFLTLPTILRHSIQLLCALILIMGVAQMLGLIDISKYSSNLPTSHSSIQNNA